MIEYRICWNASSNISFEGCTDWCEWGGFEETVDAVIEAASASPGGSYSVPPGLEEALEGSGFDWWTEAREVAS